MRSSPAPRARVHVIVTRNTSDFSAAPMLVLTPAALLVRL
jgi:hypothetical protein